MVVTVGLSVYPSRLASFSATYGALTGVIVLMLWFFASGFAVLLGGGATLGLALIALTPLADVWFVNISGLTRELADFARTPTRIMAILPALIVGFYLLYVQKTSWLVVTSRLGRAAVPAVSDEELAAYYRDNEQRLTFPEEVRVRHILLTWKPLGTLDDRAAIREQMQPILQRAREGEDFAALAREFSEDSSTRGHGGDTGLFYRGTMVPAFEAVAFSLEPGQISDTVDTLFGEGEKVDRDIAYSEAMGALAERFVASGGELLRAEVRGLESAGGVVRGVRTASGTIRSI